MKSLLKIFAIALFMFVGITHSASAANTVDMAGYAWGADNTPFGGVGWINFNNSQSTGSKTSVSNTEYKVQFNQDTWEMNGYAWSERYGYIKFGGFDATDFPQAETACAANPKNSAGYAKCNAHIIDPGNGSGFQLVGYARFCFVYASGCSGTLKPNSELAGYDGWIGFKQTINSQTYTVTYSTGSKSFGGYAWGGGSGSTSSADYGEGAGWIKMDPTNGGVKCTDGTKDIDCLNSSGPIVDLYTTLNSSTKTGKVTIRPNTDITLKWEITNVNSSCTPVTSSSPTNSAWNSYTPTGADIASGQKIITNVTESTTFTLSCTESGKKGSDDQLVELDARTPSITLSMSSTTFSYDQKADLNYSITNIPNGCNAVFMKNGTSFATDTIANNTPGDPTVVVTGTKNITNLLGATTFSATCTDVAPPSPNRIGRSNTVSIDPIPYHIDFSLLEKTTNQTYNAGNFKTGTIPCTNTGLDMKTSIEGVVIGSCKAMIDYSNANTTWGSNVSWSQTEETNYPTVTTKTTSAITQQASTILYQLQCRTLGDIVKNYSIKMSRSCTPAALSMSSTKTCVQPNQDFYIFHTGSGIQDNTCKRSGVAGYNGTIQGGNPFTTASTYIPSTLTSTWSNGQTKTFVIDSCVDASNPSGTPLTQSVSVDVKTSCTPPPCTPTNRKLCPGTPGGGGSGPVFKEF